MRNPAHVVWSFLAFTAAAGLLAAAGPPLVALRVDLEPVEARHDATALEVAIQVAPEDRSRIGASTWVELELRRGREVVERVSRAVDVDGQGRARLEVLWPPGSFELGVEIRSARGDARGLWTDRITVPRLGRAAEPTPMPATTPEPEVAPQPTPELMAAPEPVPVAIPAAVGTAAAPPAGPPVTEIPAPQPVQVQETAIAEPTPAPAPTPALQPPEPVAAEAAAPSAAEPPPAEVPAAEPVQVAETATVAPTIAPEPTAAPESMPEPVAAAPPVERPAAEPVQVAETTTVQTPSAPQPKAAPQPTPEPVATAAAAPPSAAAVMAAPEPAGAAAAAPAEEVSPRPAPPPWPELGANTADVTVLVTRMQRPVASLGPETLSLKVEGNAVPVLDLGGPGTAPLSVAVAVDLSSTMEARLPELRRQLGQLVLQVTASGGAVALIAGDAAARRTLDWGAGPEALAETLQSTGSDPEGDLAGMVASAVAAVTDRPGRRLVLVVSDGGDTASREDWRRSEDAATAAAAPILVVELPGLQGRPAAALDRLVDSSGGESFAARTEDMMGTVLRHYGELLEATYAVRFLRPKGSGSGPLKVRITTADDSLEVRHPKHVR